MNPLINADGEISVLPRRTCMKCSEPLFPPPEKNIGNHSWCPTCRWLLRVGGLRPSPAGVAALGLPHHFDDRQTAERIPRVVDVENWPEISPPPRYVAEGRSLAEMFRAAS